MSDAIEIRTKREDGKVVIEMNKDSLAANVCLLEVIIGEIYDRLWNMPETLIPKEERGEFDEICSFFSNMQDNLRGYENWVGNIPADVKLDWYDAQPAQDPTVVVPAAESEVPANNSPEK